MKLTFEQIKAVTLGALRVEDTPEGVKFYRFSQKQMEVYREIPDFFRKAHATSGVRMEFTTNATNLSLTAVASKGSSRRFAYFDVTVNGNLVAHGGEEAYTGEPFTVSTDLPQGEKEVCIYFPQLAVAVLREVSLSEGATLAPVVKSHRLLAFGDSITQGYDAFLPSVAYTSLLADYLDAEVVNNGIGAEVFRPDLVDGDIPYHPDIITVAYGTNDWSHTERQVMEKNSMEFYTRLCAAFPHAKIFAITPLWRASAATKITKVGTFEEARDLIRRAAEQNHIKVIEGDPLLPHLPEVCSDKVLHPNDLGFKFYGERLYRAMLPHLM